MKVPKSPLKSMYFKIGEYNSKRVQIGQFYDIILSSVVEPETEKEAPTQAFLAGSRSSWM